VWLESTHQENGTNLIIATLRCDYLPYTKHNVVIVVIIGAKILFYFFRVSISRLHTFSHHFFVHYFICVCRLAERAYFFSYKCVYYFSFVGANDNNNNFFLGCLGGKNYTHNFQLVLNRNQARIEAENFL
jgi:hypothetical protein